MRTSATPPMPATAPAKTSAAKVVAVIAISLLVIAASGAFLPNLLNGVLGSSTSQSQSSTQSASGQSTQTGSTSNTGSTQQLGPALIQNGSATVEFPSDFHALAAYALNLINTDRATFKLGPVTLSDNLVAQQHADSMLFYGYLSHFDTQGFKPYMRYTLLGGRAAVEENVAVETWGAPHYLNTTSVETALSFLEHSMVYNDSGCCDNGHRLNILDALHNRVDIGIAYNQTSAYFVEDFENYYANLNYTVSQNTVLVQGTPVGTPTPPKDVLVFFDATPAPLSATALNNGPRSYGPGTLLGGVLPPCQLVCQHFESGITVYAEVWTINSSSVDLMFSISSFVQSMGPGVYTLYLVNGNNSAASLTTISVFVS